MISLLVFPFSSKISGSFSYFSQLSDSSVSDSSEVMDIFKFTFSDSIKTFASELNKLIIWFSSSFNSSSLSKSLANLSVEADDFDILSSNWLQIYVKVQVKVQLYV